MTKIFVGAAALAGMTFGLSAHASCADPRFAARDGAPEQMEAPLNLPSEPREPSLSSSEAKEDAATNVVGTWIVTYYTAGHFFAQAFIQWHSDHTEWEEITQPVLGGNICMGSWVALDGSRVFRNHLGWLFTDGKVTGYFNEKETDVVAPDGNSYKGTNETRVFDMTGKLLVTFPGTSSARKAIP